MKILLQCLFILIALSATAQRYTGNKQKTIVFSNKLEISAPQIKSILQPAMDLQHIEVIDNRFDTTIWGFLKSFGNLKSIISKNNQPVSHTLREYLSNKLQLDATTGKSLFIVLQQLQFTQNHVQEEKIGFQKDKTRWLAALSLKVDFYLKEERGYSPLYRFDSTIISDEPISENETTDFIFTNLHLSLGQLTAQKFASLNPVRFVQRNQILEHNSNKFILPILQDSIFKKGAYRSYSEFKNNTPSISEFVIKTDGRTNTLMVTENGQDYPVRKIWGFCDGENIYVQSKFNYFQLQRKENSFFTLAAKGYHTKTKINGGRLLLASTVGILFPVGGFMLDDTFNVVEVNKYGLTIHAYILNMETGELY
jgi:hypothetical protein